MEYIVLDADGGEIEFRDGGVLIGALSNSSSDLILHLLRQTRISSSRVMTVAVVLSLSRSICLTLVRQPSTVLLR